jgi:hypothetical protein
VAQALTESTLTKNMIPRCFGSRSGGDEKGREERMNMSPSETKTGHALVLLSPLKNMVGDVFSGSSDCCPAAGGEHV